jgi:hypothetical protein
MPVLPIFQNVSSFVNSSANISRAVLPQVNTSTAFNHTNPTNATHRGHLRHGGGAGGAMIPIVLLVYCGIGMLAARRVRLTAAMAGIAAQATALAQRQVRRPHWE